MRLSILLVYFLLFAMTINCTEKKPSIKPIFFSNVDSRSSEIKTPEFSNKFILNEDQFLNLHFELEIPLIESLQSLAPYLSIEELLNSGNFQFSFFVDNELVYQENLTTGAGLADSKTIQLNHIVPLISPDPLDFWGWFMWLRFMKMNGGRDILSEGEHTLQIEIRPYLQLEEVLVGELLAKGSIHIETVEIPVNKDDISIQEIKPNSGWKLSNDDFDRAKIEALNKKIAQKRFEQLNGIVVIKNGELLLEEYFNGADREDLHNPRSVTKTIASTMMGIAIEEEYIANEELYLKDFYDLKNYKNFSDEKNFVTLKSLLTMSSGFLGDDNDYANPGNEDNMYPTTDWVKFALDLPIQKDKVIGRDYSYFTAGVVVLGDIIDKSVPGGLVSYTDEKLFSPLGITDYTWQYTPQKVGNTAGGLQLRAIDFAKYGQLYKAKGLWKGERILTKKWIEKSFSKHVEQNNEDNGTYGYLFWNKTYTVDGKEYEVSFCTGNGGNKIFIFKDIPFVIVITSSAYGLPYAHSDVDKMMIDYILPAFLDNP